MLPSTRRQKILALLNENEMVLITDLSAQFSVSEMTIHRDLDRLAEMGKLRKVRGGAVAVTEKETILSDTPLCHMCHTRPRRQTQVTIHLTDGNTKIACCPHCGLMMLMQVGSQTTLALVTDFLHGDTISAQDAYYVMAPDLTICCAPTAVALRREKDAQRFQKGFGGQVMRLTEAMTHLQQASQMGHGQ